MTAQTGRIQRWEWEGKREVIRKSEHACWWVKVIKKRVVQDSWAQGVATKSPTLLDTFYSVKILHPNSR